MNTEPSDDLWKRAEAEAAKVAPRPPVDPLTAGVVGGVGVFVALEVFWFLADLPRDRHDIAATVTCALGFGVPALVVGWAERRHSAARLKAYLHLLELTRQPGGR